MKTELALYQALISINVPEQKANAVIEALETDMLSRLATKADLTALAAEFKSDNVIPENVGLRLSGTLAVNGADCVPVLVEPEYVST